MERVQDNLHRLAQTGFTLIEMMIVVVILTILVTISVPAYTEQVAKSRRADAKAAILGLAQALERYSTAEGSFADAKIGSVANSIYPNQVPLDGNTKFYTLALDLDQDDDGTEEGTWYQITATRISTGAQKDDGCGDFSLTSAGVRSLANNTKSSNDCGW